VGFRPRLRNSQRPHGECDTLNVCDVVFPSSGGLVREKLLLRGLSELGHRVFLAEVLGKTSINASKIILFEAETHARLNASPPPKSKRDELAHFRLFPSRQQKEILSNVLNASEHPDQIRRFSNFLNRKRIDAVTSGDFTVTSTILCAAKKSTSIPMVTLSAGHQIAFETLLRLGFEKEHLDSIYEEALNCVDLVIAPSEFEAARTRKHFNLSTGKVSVIYNGIDIGQARRLAEHPILSKALLRKYRLKEKRFLLYVGRLDTDKGIHILPFLAKLIDEPILVAGETMYDSPQGESIFKKMITYYGVEDKLISIGYVSENEKFALMKEALATIYPSTEAESFGLVPIESVAVGTPAVLPELGPFQEIARKIGWMVRTYAPFDVSSIISSLDEVRGRDLAEVKVKALAALQTYFDYGRMAEQVGRTLDKLATRK
jgi:glycosyltransferase involved in cell wall biosynthesis